MSAVMIGIDPHKGSHTAVALDGVETKLGEIRVSSSVTQVERLLEWAKGARAHLGDRRREGPRPPSRRAAGDRRRASGRCPTEAGRPVSLSALGPIRVTPIGVWALTQA